MRLGQHFLKSKKVIDKIIEAAEIKTGDIVLEIGPGMGALTEALLENSGEVIAVEKDKELFEFLQSKFRDAKNLQLVHGDILRIEEDYNFRAGCEPAGEPSRRLGEKSKKIDNLSQKGPVKNYKIVANIPYYITGAILKKFLSSEHQPKMMVLMVQKEVAQRITAQDGCESILSISVKAHGTPKIIGYIKKGHFSPPPKVDSAIIKIENISKNFFFDLKSDFDEKEIGFREKKFFNIIKKGFSQKRKMLKNNLRISGETLKKIGLSEKARAQELSLADWKKLYQSIELF